MSKSHLLFSKPSVCFHSKSDKFVEEFPNEMIRNSIPFNFLTNLYATPFLLKKSFQQKLSCELCLLGLDKHLVWRTGWKGCTSFCRNNICLLFQQLFILWFEPSLSNCNHAANHIFLLNVSKPFLCSVFKIRHDSGLSSVKKKNLEIVRKK